MRRTVRCVIHAMIGLMLFIATPAHSDVEYVRPVKPFSRRIKARVKPVEQSVFLRVPCITWGGDVAAVFANGGHKTANGSIFDHLGLSVELYRQDDFVKQVQDYLQGKSPFLRGTLGMINTAAEVCNKDRRTELVVIVQLTWSQGGDMLVVRKYIKRPRDLKGKTICLQQYSPHVDYLDTILKDAGLTWKDVKVKFTSELTQPAYETHGKVVDPAGAMRQDPSIDAICCISPDGMALTSGGKGGTGAEDSVKGAKILLSTRTANRVIADVWAVRRDFFEKHKKTVEKFVIGYLQGVEAVQRIMKNKEQKLKDYTTLLSGGATFLFDSDRATADVEGLLGDCAFVGFTGNVDFFTNKGNLNNFKYSSARIQRFLVREKYARRRVNITRADWEYRRWQPYLQEKVSFTESTLKRKSKPSSLRRSKTVNKAGKDDVLFEFTIHFKPNQKEFSEKQYAADFRRAIEIAGRYGGAIVQVAGHSDPLAILKTKKKIKDAKKESRLDLQQAYEQRLALQLKAVKSLSKKRAENVRSALIAYAKKRGLTIDPEQFTVAGFGIDSPLFPKPRSKEQWLANMRVVFRIINVEAELEQFETVDF